MEHIKIESDIENDFKSEDLLSFHEDYRERTLPMSVIYIKTRLNNNVKYVKLFEEDLVSPENIILSILSDFREEPQPHIVIRDNDGVDLNLQDLPGLIQQYRGCNCFTLVLELNRQSGEIIDRKTDETTSTKITSQALHQYFTQNIPKILSEYAMHESLTDSSRRSVVNFSVNFLRSKHGNYPTKQEKIALAKAIVTLFPTYKLEDSTIGGFELFYDPKKNTGYISSKLKNINFKRLTLEGHAAKKRKTSNTITSHTQDNNMVLDEEDRDFFQRCLVNEDKELIKIKLKNTIDARKLIYTNPINIFADFPFLFYDVTLIDYDFKLRFPDYDENLHLKWPLLSNAVEKVTEQTLGKLEIIFPGWSKNIKLLGHLLKLLPSTAKGVKYKNCKRLSSEQSLSKLIVFESDNTPKEQYSLVNKQPFLIATGPNPSTISQYFLSVDGRLITIPVDYTFVKAFDLLFKSFYVFNINFDYDLETFYHFFAIFIYKIELLSKATTRLREVHSKFEKFIEK